MINWLRAKTNPIPIHYDCLFLLSSGDIVIGKYDRNMDVIGWTVANKPEWFKQVNVSYPSGENHFKARLSDDDCRLIRELYDDKRGGLTYAQIAIKFECSKSTIRDIVKYRTRR